MMLGDAPGGEVLIEALVGSLNDLSLLYAGTPDDKARSSLEGYISRIEPSIAEALGSSNAARLVETFRRGVMGRKYEIEGCGASRS
jgi:hypothetical protein